MVDWFNLFVRVGIIMVIIVSLGTGFADYFGNWLDTLFLIFGGFVLGWVVLLAFPDRLEGDD